MPTPEKPKKKAAKKAAGLVERRRASDRVMLAAIGELTTEVRHLRDEVAARPSRTEVTGMRRLAVFGVVALIFFTMQTVDMHTEACSPGHRAEVVLNNVLEGNVTDQESFIKAINKGTPSDFCGFTFPTHTHDGNDWPEKQHLLGVAFYALIFIGLWLWVRAGFDENRNLINFNRRSKRHGDHHPDRPAGLPVEDGGGDQDPAGG